MGVALLSVGFSLERGYQKFRAALVAPFSPEIIPSVPFLTRQERRFYSEITAWHYANEGEERFRRISPSVRARGSSAAVPSYQTARKEIQGWGAELSGESWMVFAAKGQLAIRDLQLGIFLKADQKELQ